MSLQLTKLAAALFLTSSLVGCAAIVKTPYEQPNIQIPGSFQNSPVMVSKFMPMFMQINGGHCLETSS